ncbi:MAG: amino acid-binding protein [Clostridiales bacterium]|nr:amino acid-binding protein [Clostridiales bacterium]
MVKQISVFIENTTGRLIAVTSCLAENKINIRALSVADTSDFGILRLIVDHPNRAYRTLREAGFTVRETAVLALEVADEVGGINAGLNVLEQAGINVEYIYAFLSVVAGKALNILKVDNMEEAVQALKKAGLRLLEGEEIHMCGTPCKRA